MWRELTEMKTEKNNVHKHAERARAGSDEQHVQMTSVLKGREEAKKRAGAEEKKGVQWQI